MRYFEHATRTSCRYTTLCVEPLSTTSYIELDVVVYLFWSLYLTSSPLPIFEQYCVPRLNFADLFDDIFFLCFRALAHTRFLHVLQPLFFRRDTIARFSDGVLEACWLLLPYTTYISFFDGKFLCICIGQSRTYYTILTMEKRTQGGI